MRRTDDGLQGPFDGRPHERVQLALDGDLLGIENRILAGVVGAEHEPDPFLEGPSGVPQFPELPVVVDPGGDVRAGVPDIPPDVGIFLGDLPERLRQKLHQAEGAIAGDGLRVEPRFGDRLRLENFPVEGLSEIPSAVLFEDRIVGVGADQVFVGACRGNRLQQQRRGRRQHRQCSHAAHVSASAGCRVRRVWVDPVWFHSMPSHHPGPQDPVRSNGLCLSTRNEEIRIPKSEVFFFGTLLWKAV